MDIGDRFKQYEGCSEQVLPSNLPVIVRIDGASFSNLTSGKQFAEPFDDDLAAAFNAAAREVLDYCSGSQFAYLQSDEISVLLRNTMRQETQPFLGNRTQKLASLLASKTAVAFDRALGVDVSRTVAFDARAFVVPCHEVANYFLWRQWDCERNFYSQVANWVISFRGDTSAEKKLHGVSTEERKVLLRESDRVDLSTIDQEWKLGRCVYSETYETTPEESMEGNKLAELVEKGHIEDPCETIKRSRWVEEAAPRFEANRDYINRWMVDE